MPGTFSQIYIQIVFAVRYRQSLIQPEWEEDLYRYITGIIQNKQQLLIAINGVPDHIHILIGMRPSCCLSDLVREIKKASTNYINDNRLSRHRFSWQEGFGAFSYSYASKDRVARYIQRQKEHHQKQTFKEEYTNLLEEFAVDHQPQYLFEWLDETELY